MASSHRYYLKALVAFKNIMYPELIRTVHVYQLANGVEEVLEREYLFHRRTVYEETGSYKVLTLGTFRLSAEFEGRVNGVWLCIYVFDADRYQPEDLNRIPSIFSIFRNPKLASIPTLANDLAIIFQSGYRVENREAVVAVEHFVTDFGLEKQQFVPKFAFVELKTLSIDLWNWLLKRVAVVDYFVCWKCEVGLSEQSGSVWDINVVPYLNKRIENEFFKSAIVGKKKKRAATKDVARIALADLVQYFDLPIIEASKNLKVGLTVLKKKCREFGIPRWPHRKIKSLGGLIRDLQEVLEHQKQEDAAAAKAVAKRQRMLENLNNAPILKWFCFSREDTALQLASALDIDELVCYTRNLALRTWNPDWTSNNYSNGGGFSATSSSAGQSRFSAAASDQTYLSGEILPTPNLKIYNFADLKSAARNFKSDTVLGVGGFGTVFKGWVDEKTLAPSKFGTGMIVAIKKLNPSSVQGFDEWQSEVNFLGRLSHPNLVKLLGYCWEDKELLLVYEFMPRGSLENHLFRRISATEPLSWDLRLKIAIGAARGLAFLHTSEKQVIYRDFKASNILLDGNYNAKISDFGLAKLGPSGGNSHVTTRVMGTYGYAAPEYIATGHLYVKSDVYGFGVVLLELLTGLRALDNKRPSGQHNLVDWAKPLLSHKRKLKSIMDARMEGQYSSKVALQAAQLTIKCLETDPKSRPSMKEVVEVLERIEAMEKPKESKNSSTHSTADRRGQPPIHHRSPLHPSHPA
ncbi:hypothetical protein F0562_004016 [Nyssa sinensis]|uniref:non-specific serine/threonine protein kinase n=1 Tax=Nyssa sinensis TaxID=561372 RepID=A0A5J5C0Y2_9ASTE|nr:hypothetical protein F0562_004016 [Nyssa sinensis]